MVANVLVPSIKPSNDSQTLQNLMSGIPREGSAKKPIKTFMKLISDRFFDD